ncbi:MAG: DM13 domain-containing protein [Acidimicrobiales bacterium]
MPQTTAAPPAAQPVPLRVGAFRGVDHRASGTVAIYRQPDGRYVVGLEDFDIQPGPDYDVYVVPGSDKEERSGGARLDDLRGNRGTQYYEVPAEVDLGSGPWSVLVWCQTFAVPVATATPA